MATWNWPGSTLVRVVDGDTVVVEVNRDLGFNGRAVFTQRIRLNRINAPKVSTAAGKEAKAALQSMLEGIDFDLTTVGPYKYGDEWMGEVVVPQKRNVSDVMVSSGHAVYWDGNGPRPADA